MIIDETSYKLPLSNYLLNENDKKHIVIGHTFNHNMRHVMGWLHRTNGKYKKTAAFTIDTAGFVYKHFEPKHQANFFGDSVMDGKSIVILLENQGWLIKDKIKNEFITWNGDIYNQPENVVEKKWRGYDYWCPYTKEQMESMVILVKKLSEDFSIPLSVISHNTKINNLIDCETILYRSNLNKQYSDLSPAWDYGLFKKIIEENKQI